MNCYRHIVFFIVLCLGTELMRYVHGTEKDKKNKVDNEDIFQPNSEWQPLKKGNIF